MRPSIRFLLLAAVALLTGRPALAELVVIVDAKSAVTQLTQDEVINIFLGRHRRLPTGIAAVPIDQPATGELRATFYRKLVDKNPSEINAYWSRLYFSGKTRPPVQASNMREVIDHILATPGGIGYIERDATDAKVRVVFSLPP